MREPLLSCQTSKLTKVVYRCAGLDRIAAPNWGELLWLEAGLVQTFGCTRDSTVLATIGAVVREVFVHAAFGIF